MQFPNSVIKSLIALGLAVAAVPLAAEPGLALKICLGCHGDNGLGGDTDTPIIAGIPALVQEDALYAYIDGERKCGSKPLMCMAVSKLTDDQVTALAEHYAAMPFVAAGESFDTDLAAKGEAIHDEACAICHGKDDPGEAEASILHGQRMGYLRYSLQQYAAGERAQLPPMAKKTGELTDEDIEALLHYYASYTQ